MSAIGGEVGSVVGDAASAATGIPGLGQILGAVGSLFGGKPHYTPGGMEYKTASHSLYDYEVSINTLYQQVHGAVFDADVPSVIPAGNHPYFSSVIAKWLDDPALAHEDYLKLLADGSADSAVAAQKAFLAQLQSSASSPIAGLTGIASNPTMLLLLVIAAFFLVKEL